MDGKYSKFFYFRLLPESILQSVNATQTLESVDESLKCDHSNESYCVVLSCGTVYYAVQGGSS